MYNMMAEYLYDLAKDSQRCVVQAIQEPAALRSNSSAIGGQKEEDNAVWEAGYEAGYKAAFNEIMEVLHQMQR